MALKTFILFSVSIVNTAIATFIYFRGRQNKANVWYTLFILTVALWVFGLALFFQIENEALSILLAKGFYFFALLIAPLFFIFAFLFLSETRPIPIYFKLFAISTIAIAGGLILFGDSVITGVGYENGFKSVQLNKFGYLFYNIYFAIFIILAYKELFKKYVKSVEIQKIQLIYIIFGTMFPFVAGMFFNLFLPWFTYEYIWVGPIFSIFTAATVVYAITKHHLMEIKAVSAEILTFLILLVLFVKIFFAANPAQRLLDIGIFAVILIFSAFLIKSVLNEVKQKEQERQINEHLQRINEELRELDSAKSEFISIAAHQLRTPLTVSKGYVSMILGGDYGKISEEEKAALSKVFLSNERLIRLVNDFLDVSKIETGKLQFDFKKTDVVNLISSVVEELASAAADSNLYLKFEKPKERIPEVVADELKIRQVVMNLIDNAVKYTQTGGITVSIELTGGAPNYVKIKIADTGVGLDKNEIERLFTKFTRTESGKKAHAGGAGIGLYIAKVITEKHGGKIWAESEGKGKGSAFFVTLSVWPE